MSSEGNSLFMGVEKSTLDDSGLVVAAASELTSPLVLLRQLGLAIGADILDENERLILSKRLTLTSERALRMARAVSQATYHFELLALEPVNAISVCKEVIHELSPLFAAHGHSITMQQRSRAPLMVANRGVLQQILLSFGDNALHYGSKSHPIRMTISGHGSFVRIGVRDFGPAVPSDIWQRIEGRVARRAAAPVASRPTMSAVGLIAARRLAEQMGSSIGLTRHRDGATFYVDLHVSGQMILI